MGGLGKDFCATQDCNIVPDGRGIWTARTNNWQYANEVRTDPWRGAMTVPRGVFLTHTADGHCASLGPIGEREVEPCSGPSKSTNSTVSGVGALAASSVNRKT